MKGGSGLVTGPSVYVSVGLLGVQSREVPECALESALEGSLSLSLCE